MALAGKDIIFNLPDNCFSSYQEPINQNSNTNCMIGSFRITVHNIWYLFKSEMLTICVHLWSKQPMESQQLANDNGVLEVFISSKRSKQ